MNSGGGCADLSYLVGVTSTLLQAAVIEPGVIVVGVTSNLLLVLEASLPHNDVFDAGPVTVLLLERNGSLEDCSGLTKDTNIHDDDTPHGSHLSLLESRTVLSKQYGKGSAGSLL
jgi:hypothetical protein